MANNYKASRGFQQSLKIIVILKGNYKLASTMPDDDVEYDVKYTHL